MGLLWHKEIFQYAVFYQRYGAGLDAFVIVFIMPAQGLSFKLRLRRVGRNGN